MSSSTAPLYWQATPEHVAASNIDKFRRLANQRFGLDLKTYNELHAWSVADETFEDFWMLLWSYVGIRASQQPQRALSDPKAKPGDLPRFFPGARLSLAENILFPIHPQNATSCNAQSPRSWPPASEPALIEMSEATQPEAGRQGSLGTNVTWGELRDRVAVMAEVLRRKGIKKGDRVAHVSANTSRPIVVLLAVLSIGAIFSSIATDAGATAIYSRLSQIRPKLLFTDEDAVYAGKRVDLVARVEEVADRLPEVEVVVFRSSSSAKPFKWTARTAATSYTEYVASSGLKTGPGTKVPPHRFEQLDFADPALIVFSSGTTGEPKSIVHGSGGLIVSLKREALLHYDLKPGSRFAQLTSTGWIMHVLQLSVLLSGGCAILYDGAFLYPDATHIPRLLAARGDVMGFGCSPRFLSELERTCKAKGFVPSRDLDLSSLKIITSTGAPLGAANAAFVYKSFAPKAQLSSISGGTDIAAAFVGSAVTTPVYGNLICAKGLGFDIGILDPISGEDIERTGEAGELVCRKPFPTQPLMFWGEAKDRAKLHEKYMDSYYRRYPEGSVAEKVWAQGDFILRDSKTGCLDICGRSDGVLNPSGVRFGSAEIYHVLEGFSHVVLDAICVGQRRPNKDDDERVLLFVQLVDGSRLTDSLKRDISQAIRKAYSPRHVPAHIFQVDGIPVTANGKKTELAVKQIVCGNVAFKPSTATANPHVLDQYRQYAELEQVLAKQPGGAKL